jgi:hypothetical protein
MNNKDYNHKKELKLLILLFRLYKEEIKTLINKLKV